MLPPDVVQARFLATLGENAYSIDSVLVYLHLMLTGDRIPDEVADETVEWARQQGFLFDGRAVTGLTLDDPDYVRAQHLDAILAHYGTNVDAATLEREVERQERVAYQIDSLMQRGREIIFATPQGRALQRLMDAAKATPETATSVQLSPRDNYTLQLLVDEQGKPRPLTEERTTMLKAVETIDVLALRGSDGDERATAFVTRLVGYMKELGRPVADGTPLTQPQQMLFEEFRREVTHAHAYQHLCR